MMRPLVATIALGFLPACFFPDVPSLQAKMVKCNVRPEGPSCAQDKLDDEDDPGARRLMERFLSGMNSGKEQECFLAVDCSDERLAADDGDPALELVNCLHSDDAEDLLPDDSDRPSVSDWTDDQQACMSACFDDVTACGSPDACGADVVDECLNAEDACEDACFE